jgi:hypothetical protein
MVIRDQALVTKTCDPAFIRKEFKKQYDALKGVELGLRAEIALKRALAGCQGLCFYKACGKSTKGNLYINLDPNR